MTRKMQCFASDNSHITKSHSGKALFCQYGESDALYHLENCVQLHCAKQQVAALTTGELADWTRGLVSPAVNRLKVRVQRGHRPCSLRPGPEAGFRADL